MPYVWCISARALGLKYYSVCVPKEQTQWNTKYSRKEDVKEQGKCSWKYLHSVDSLTVNIPEFLSLYRMIERDLIISKKIILKEEPIVVISPHANG